MFSNHIYFVTCSVLREKRFYNNDVLLMNLTSYLDWVVHVVMPISMRLPYMVRHNSCEYGNDESFQ